MAAGVGTVQYATRRFVLVMSAVTFLAVCGAIFTYQWIQDRKEVASLVKGCERTNVLRAAVDSFLKAARDAREDEGNYETANQYQDIINDIEGVEHAKKGKAEVKCAEAFAR